MKRLSIRSTPPEVLPAGSENAVDPYLFTGQCCAFLDPQGGSATAEDADEQESAPTAPAIPEESK